MDYSPNDEDLLEHERVVLLEEQNQSGEGRRELAA